MSLYGRIIANRAQCAGCRKTMESWSKGEVVRCDCGNQISGGIHMLTRLQGPNAKLVELSVVMPDPRNPDEWDVPRLHYSLAAWAFFEAGQAGAYLKVAVPLMRGVAGKDATKVLSWAKATSDHLLRMARLDGAMELVFAEKERAVEQ